MLLPGNTEAAEVGKVGNCTSVSNGWLANPL